LFIAFVVKRQLDADKNKGKTGGEDKGKTSYYGGQRPPKPPKKKRKKVVKEKS